MVDPINGSRNPTPLSSLAFVVCYFGKLPNYFPLFLHTAAANSTIHFKIFGDVNVSGLELPPNVTFTPMTLAEIAGRAEGVFGFKPVLPGPYKLCDYKPVYGPIFAPELRGFDYWGHCDIDVLLGDLRAYLTEQLLHQQLRTFMSGHLSVYRNTDEGNNIFRLTAPGVDYHEVFTDPRNRIFDEWEGMYLIHQHHHIPYYHDDTTFADTMSLKSDLRAGRGELAEAAQVFAWERGEIIQFYESHGHVLSKKYMHLHLQKRPMTVAGTLEQFQKAERWYITGDRFLPGKIEPLTPSDFRQMNPRRPLRDLRRQAGRPLQRVRRMFKEWRLLRQTASSG